MAREIGSWLSGPQSAEAPDDGYPGQRLGLPASGLAVRWRGWAGGSAALLVDWLIGYGLAGLATATGLSAASRCLATAVLRSGSSSVSSSVRLFGFTPGQYAAGSAGGLVDNRLHVGTGRATGAVC